MAVLIKRRDAQPKKEETSTETLIAIGLLDPRPKVKPEEVPYFSTGQRVSIAVGTVGDPAVWHKGDTGRIRRLCKARGMYEKRPQDDMYFVDLDVVRVPGKPVAYLKFEELQPVKV